MTTSFCFDFALSSQLRRIKRISAMRQRPSSISASRLNHLAQVAISVGTSANSVKPSKILRSAAFLTVHYTIKLFGEPSEFGINHGKISKLELRQDGEIVANYDRGWDICPTTKEAELALCILLNRHN